MKQKPNCIISDVDYQSFRFDTINQVHMAYVVTYIPTFSRVCIEKVWQTRSEYHGKKKAGKKTFFRLLFTWIRLGLRLTFLLLYTTTFSTLLLQKAFSKEQKMTQECKKRKYDLTHVTTSMIKNRFLVHFVHFIIFLSFFGHF